MGAAESIATSLRAKHLGLGEGRFHGRETLCAVAAAPVAAPSREPPSSGARLRSKKRAAVRDELGPALGVAMSVAGVHDPDVAAEIDESPQRVAKMRAKALPLNAEHLACLARSKDGRLREVFEHMVREMRG